jgi:hypothetical protein
MPLKSVNGICAALCGALMLTGGHALAAGNDELELEAEAGASAGGVETTTAEPAAISGFRSAAFGMTMDEVRAAAISDFGLTEDQIEEGANALEKTTSLRIVVTDLVPESGPARVVYIFGYESQRLIQVNIIWGADGDNTAQQIRTAASLLVSYFRSQNFDPEKTVVGATLDNGALLAFYAEDGDGSSVTLTVASRSGGEEAAEDALLMQLSYVADFANPDIFRLPDGSF